MFAFVWFGAYRALLEEIAENLGLVRLLKLVGFRPPLAEGDTQVQPASDYFNQGDHRAARQMHLMYLAKTP
jgi:hypothetical protein